MTKPLNRIQIYENKLNEAMTSEEQEWIRTHHKACIPRGNHVNRARKALKLAHQKVVFKEVPQGLESGRIIVAGVKNKYRFKGKAKWYWYNSIAKLVKKHHNDFEFEDTDNE